MPGASLALFADLGACHVQKSSVTICVLPAPFRWKATRFKMLGDHAPIIISIRALRVEGDPAAALGCLPTAHFYPRPPGGGRRFHQCNRSAAGRISIHALRVEGDFLFWRSPGVCNQFLSTPSGWRATVNPFFVQRQREISIHALRVEGDRRNRKRKRWC